MGKIKCVECDRFYYESLSTCPYCGCLTRYSYRNKEELYDDSTAAASYNRIYRHECYPTTAAMHMQKNAAPFSPQQPTGKSPYLPQPRQWQGTTPVPYGKPRPGNREAFLYRQSPPNGASAPQQYRPVFSKTEPGVISPIVLAILVVVFLVFFSVIMSLFMA